MKKNKLWDEVGVNYKVIDWQHPIRSKIKDFATFEEGWHYGEGESFSNEIISLALEVHDFFYNNSFLTLDAFPGFNGEIRVTAYPKNYYFEATIEDVNNITFLIEDSNDEEIFYADNLSIEELKTLIKEKADLYIWNTVESFPFVTTTIERKDSLASPSKIHLQSAEEEFLLFNWNAQTKRQVVYVNTFAPIMTNSVQAHHYSGNSKNQNYLMEAN